MQPSAAIAISGVCAHAPSQNANWVSLIVNATVIAAPLNSAEVNLSLAINNTTRVMVAEDEAMVGILLADLLEDMGFDVCSIESTEMGAVNSALLYKPHLMIVDARLRDGSGVKAVEQIISEGFVPHIFISGDKLTPSSLHPQAIILQKPFLESSLISAIEKALGRAIS